MDRHTYIDGCSLKPQGLSIIERISISILYSWTDGECYLGKNEWGMNFVQPWFKASLHIGPGFDWAMSLHMARIPMSCVRTVLKQGIWWLATRQCCLCFGPFFSWFCANAFISRKQVQTVLVQSKTSLLCLPNFQTTIASHSLYLLDGIEVFEGCNSAWSSGSSSHAVHMHRYLLSTNTDFGKAQEIKLIYLFLGYLHGSFCTTHVNQHTYILCL